MKLTNTDRAAFVRAVLDDVPTEDYAEQYRSLVHAEAERLLPPKIAAIYKDKKLRPWLRTGCVVLGVGAGYVETVGLSETSETVAANLKSRRAELSALNTAQQDRQRSLREKLTAVIAGCSTLKQAQERLPEFVKYLPADRGQTGTANLPAVSGVVADLVKAGWPKGGKK